MKGCSGLIHLDQNTPTLYCNERLQWFNTPEPEYTHSTAMKGYSGLIHLDQNTPTLLQRKVTVV